MKPSTICIYQLFENRRRYVVPLFQRAYVWTEEKQWLPLWADVRDRAEALLRAGNERSALGRVYPHFLGAIVTSQSRVFGRQVHAYAVIDGQQRLTTLQIFLAAFRDYAAAQGDPLHEDLARATRNEGTLESEDERFKVWPTNVDRDAFAAVLDAGSRDAVEAFIDEEKRAWRAAPKFGEGYLCFYAAIRAWVEGTDHEEPPSVGNSRDRMRSLFEALRNLVQVVEIALEDGDDPQVIFETLNARGEPLLASDLVKNHIFTLASRAGDDVDQLYERYWRKFDDVDAEPFWKVEVPFGRERRERLVLFLFHFLTSQLATEVSLSHLFDAFKHWWGGPTGPASVEAGLLLLQRHAAAYRRLEEPDEETRLGAFARRLDVLEVSTLHPVLLHLLADRDLAADLLQPILDDLESFLVRRVVCRLTSKNLNRLTVAMLRNLNSGSESAQAAVRDALVDGTGDSVRWPSDAEFSHSWLAVPAYKAVRKRGVAMILAAIDQKMVTGYQEGVHVRSKLTVEHVMPQAWRNRWPEPRPSDNPLRPADAARDTLLHSFGNLTLLTQKLNSKVSNAPFEQKRENIVRQSALRLNSYFLDERTWDESRIEERGRRLLASALEIWPCPQPAAEQTPTSFQPVLNAEADTALLTLTGPTLSPDALASFKRMAPEDVHLVRPGKRYQQIRIPRWPTDVHYEFFGHDDVVGIDIHVELKEGNPLRQEAIAQLDALLPVVRTAFPGFESKRVDKGSWRWLSVEVPVGAVPGDQLGEGMLRLIELTRPRLDAFFAEAEGTAAA